MIQSFVFSDGKLVGRNLEIEALRIVRADKGLILWVDLESPTDEEIKMILEGVFPFHPLAIEDCMTPSSLPKIEDYEDYLFVVTHAIEFTRATKFMIAEVDMFLGKDYLVTFHREPARCVTTMRDRMTKNTGVIARGPDRLAHTLLDLIVDHYAPVMDALRGELEEIEERMLARTSEKEFVSELLQVRGDFSRLRTIIRPQRDMIERLARGESKMIRPVMLPYYRDVRDNLARLEETAINYHERLMLAFDIFLNKAAFEASEGIKFLTAVTAVTLPAVVIGGWYGMNFAQMPELQWRHGYIFAWLLMLSSTLVMIFYIKKKKWF